MVEKSTKKFIKVIDYSSSYDSDGGGDYVDNTDDLQTAKFNYRWNNNDAMLRSLQRNIEYIKHNLASQKTFSFMEYPGPYGSNPTDLPFQSIDISGSSLEFGINTSNSVVLSKDLSTVVAPYGKFIDFIEPENPGLTLASGSSDLGYIQDDYGTGGVDTFYRVGHAGTESTPEIVTYASPVISSDNSIVYGKFYDHGLGVSGKPQIIRISSTVHNEFLEIVIDPTHANYRINAELWNGASLTSYSNVDSGIARSIGFHNFKMVVTKLSSIVILDSSTVFNQTDTIETVTLYEIESQNNTGSGDYFDVYPTHIFSVPYLTMTANSWNYIYYDYNTETFGVSTTWTANNINKIIVYTVYLPLGATGINLADVNDFRAPGRVVNGNLIYEVLNITDLNANGIIKSIKGAAGNGLIEITSAASDYMAPFIHGISESSDWGYYFLAKPENISQTGFIVAAMYYNARTNAGNPLTTGSLIAFANDDFIKFRVDLDGGVNIGIWKATAIADAYIASASTWNAKVSPSLLNAYLAIGVANHKYIGGTFYGEFNNGEWKVFEESIWNVGTADLLLYLTVPLSMTLGSLKLYIDGIQIRGTGFSQDGTVDSFKLFGSNSEAIIKTVSGFPWSAEELKQEAFTAIDCSGEEQVTIEINCSSSFASVIKITSIAVRYYYDT